MFEKAKNINNSKSKNLNIEITNIYCKLISSFIVKYKLACDKDNAIKINTIERLKELNIIEEESELKLIKKRLKPLLFNNFISAINCSEKYKTQLGDLFKSIDPTLRLKAQELSRLKNKPKIIDFFCGAGGLSLGFVQEGFKIELANDYDDVCIETYRYNHPEIPDDRIIHGDIRDIVNHLELYSINNIDVVIGALHAKVFSPQINKE